jgi:hypothetical protein
MSRWDNFCRAIRLPSVERDVEDEIQFHLDSRVRDLIARGHNTGDARQLAELEFGDVNAARRELAAVDLKKRSRVAAAEWWDAFAHDVRFSLR